MLLLAKNEIALNSFSRGELFTVASGNLINPTLGCNSINRGCLKGCV
jgi:hypothetical protein